MRPAIALALLAALLASAASARVADEDVRLASRRVKAAFLYKFATYVEWPEAAFAEPESPIVIGIAGADELARELARAVAGRKLGARPLHVHGLAAGERADDCCQILFIGAVARSRLEQLLGEVEGRPVLTVTEAAGHPKGSVINFLLVEDRVRFDIARAAAERNGLQLRAQLLAVARQVSAP